MRQIKQLKIRPVGMLFLYFYVPFLLVIPYFSCSQPVVNSCEEMLKEYAGLISNNTYKKDTAFLLNKLSDILSQDSSCVDAYLNRADLYFLLEDLNAAFSDYEKVLLFDPNNIYSLYKMGVINQEQEKDSFAVVLFERAISLKKVGNTIVSYNSEGAQGNDGKEKYDVQASILMFAQGVSYYYLKKFDKALSRFNFCIANGYYLSKSHFYRGVIYLEAKLDKEACDDLLLSNRLGNEDALGFIEKFCK